MNLSNLYLIGMMGTGKSTVGKLLSNKLGMDFIDSDNAIEDDTGKTISEIFSTEGEDKFRQLEKDFVNSGHPSKNCIISCGGGLPIIDGVMDQLKEKGMVVCLWAEPETIIERVGENTARPLLHVENPLLEMKSILATRKMIYLEADSCIPTDGLSPDEVTDRLIELRDLSNI